MFESHLVINIFRGTPALDSGIAEAPHRPCVFRQPMKKVLNKCERAGTGFLRLKAGLLNKQFTLEEDFQDAHSSTCFRYHACQIACTRETKRVAKCGPEIAQESGLLLCSVEEVGLGSTPAVMSAATKSRPAMATMTACLRDFTPRHYTVGNPVGKSNSFWPCGAPPTCFFLVSRSNQWRTHSHNQCHGQDTNP